MTALSNAQIAEGLAKLEGWGTEGKALTREFSFPDSTGHAVLADSLLHAWNGCLWKGGVPQEFRGHVRADQGMISAVPLFARLPDVVQRDRRPDRWQIATFASRDGVSQRHHTGQMVKIMRGIFAALTLHRFSGEFQQPAPKQWLLCFPARAV